MSMAGHLDLVPGSRAAKAVAGTVVVALVLGAAAWLGGSYLGWFTRDLVVEARLPVSGDSLGVNSDVKFRGLRVGRVVEVQQGAEPVARVIVLAEHADGIPADVRARVLPGTLFGNEYVDLVPPPRKQRAADPGRLADGAVVPADDSVATVRLMDAFTSVQRLLVAVDPARLDVAISQLAGALSGHGDDLHRFLRDAKELVDAWEEVAPDFHRDVALVAENADTFAELEPTLVRVLRNSLPVARLWAKEQEAVERLLSETATLLGTAEAFLSAQQPVLAPILHHYSAITRVMAANSDLFARTLAGLPPVMENGADAVQGSRIQMEGVIGLQLPAPYDADDCPRYGALKGPGCR